MARIPGEHRRPDPPEYRWRDTLDCGHTRTVTTFVPFDRSQPWEPVGPRAPAGLVGSPTVCFDCRPRNYDARIVSTEQVDQASAEADWERRSFLP